MRAIKGDGAHSFRPFINNGKIMSRLIKASWVVYALISAITLALLSVFVERTGPELAQYGDSIFKPVLQGGFPLAYLFDAPGVSVERQLSFGEDKLFVGSLIIDIAIYFAAILIAALVVSRYLSAHTTGTSRGST
jgi:hypothetical protein